MDTTGLTGVKEVLMLMHKLQEEEKRTMGAHVCSCVLVLRLLIPDFVMNSNGIEVFGCVSLLLNLFDLDVLG